MSFINKVNSAGVLNFGGAKEMPKGNVLHFILYTASCVKKHLLFAPFAPHPDPSPSQLRWGLSPPESRSQLSLTASGVRLRSFIAERQAKPRRQEEDK